MSSQIDAYTDQIVIHEFDTRKDGDQGNEVDHFIPKGIKSNFGESLAAKSTS